MKSSSRVALTGLALLAAALPAAAVAQAPAGAAAPTAAAKQHKVGLVDMAFIFQKYKKLEDLRNQLKAEYEASDDEVKALQTNIQEMQKVLQSDTLKKGTDTYNEAEQKFVEAQAQLRAKMTNLNREFARKEALMYKDVYGEVSTLVTQYADYYKYTLILRYQRETEEEKDDVSKVVNRLNQLVVYHEPSDDITDKLLKVLNDRYTAQAGKAGAAPAAAAPGAATTRQR